MSIIKVTFKPTSNQIEEIKDWLIDEEKKYKEGFFCNWDSIQHSFDDAKIAVLTCNKNSIGFITWFEWEKVTRIQIAEIRPGYRQKGLGKFLSEKLFERLSKRGFIVLDLHCQPSSSEKVWKKLGFKRFPEAKDFERENSASGRHLYKILVPHLKPTKSLALKESIELWYEEPHLARTEHAQLKWHPKFQKGTRNLIQPIIHPAKRDWQISWNRLEEIPKTDKIKYFSRNEIDFGNFIIISTLPLN